MLIAAPAAALMIDGRARVVDGDTLEVGGKMVRLFGIDAPERDQTCTRAGVVWDCGAWATDALRGLVGRGQVVCDPQDTDRYGRIVAICTANGVDLGAAQVQAGAARAYLRYSDRYARAEGVAAGAGVGIWAAQMVAPEVFRQADTQTAPTDCIIKGNIGSKGAIYHRPGQRDYAATQVNTSKGEAWFCTEAEAKAAGFRPAKR